MKRPQYQESDSDPEEYHSDSGHCEQEEPEEYGKQASFGELSRKKRSIRQRQQPQEQEESESDDSGPEEETTSRKKRHKHAPTEASSKRPVSVIRDIPGLQTKSKSLYRDIRFDPTYGKADLHKTRQNYAFLDEYRESELKEMREQLKKTKDPRDREQLNQQIKSLQSQLDTLKRRDFEHNVIQNKKRELKKSNKNPYYLKRSEQKKLILEERFKSMKKKDVEKALMKKRKKNAAKERKAMPMERRS